MSEAAMMGHDDGRSAGLARATIWTVCAALAGFFAWAAVTPVHEVVTGRGLLVPEGRVTRVEHLAGGRVADVLVREGDAVRGGDVLLRFAREALEAERRTLAAQLDGLDADIARHEALQSLGDAGRAAAPAHIGPGAASPAEAELLYRQAQLASLRARREVAVARRQALLARRAKYAREIAIVSERVERLGGLANPAAIARREVDDATRELIGLERASAELDGEEAILAATVAQIDAERAELVAAYRREAALSLAEKRERRLAAAEGLAQVEDALRRTEVLAPIDGVVSALGMLGAGEVAGPGERLAEIVPTGAALHAEVQVPADRIGGVTPGLRAEVKIRTYDFTRYGGIEARVRAVSPSSFPNAAGEDVYTVVLALPEEIADASGRSPRLRLSAGMTVAADIETDRRSVLTYLVRPARILADGSFTEP